MQPLYFGPAGRQLLGLYHQPEVRRNADTAVVLCYPAVQEYNRTHFAFRKLAGLLAQTGFHVLRFDYSGTGDSAGESDEGSVARWREDIRCAAAEVRDLAGVDRLSLVGLRLGAALGVLAAGDGMDLQDLVLWEPVLDGASHLHELEQIQQVRGQRLPARARIGPEELLDYPMPSRLRGEIAAIDLRSSPPLSADRVLVFAGRPRSAHRDLLESLHDRSGGQAVLHVVPDEADAAGEGILLSTRILRAIASELDSGGLG